VKGQRGYAVSEEPGGYRVGQVDTDADTDTDADSGTELSRQATPKPKTCLACFCTITKRYFARA
jgi:hypothetical protein